MFKKSLAAVVALGCLSVAPSAVIAAYTHTAAIAPTQVPDDTLKDRVNYRLETSPLVRKYDVHVKVEKGVVTLTGDVATAAQKAEAEKLAHVQGVAKVDNQIKVDPDEDKTVADRIKSGMSKTGEAINDTWITTKVHWFFMGEDLLKGSDINVDTKDHVVTLKGTVKTSAGRARAVALAKDTDGVTKVVDQLTIK
jgi:osmotically-inducible protein OsmY